MFFLFTTSITWLGEFTVLGLFNSYAYQPSVFEDPWAENLLAHLILNSTLWPGTAIFVVAYSLGYIWIALISAGYIVIEYFFVKYELYEHHWWTYSMTACTVALFLVISKKWFSILRQERQGIFRFITLYLAAFVIIHLPMPLLLLWGKQFYNVELTQNLYLSSTIFIFLYQLAETFIMMIFIFLNNWYGKLVPFLIAIVGQSILASRNILIFQGGGNLLYTILAYTVSITICILMEKYTLRPKK
jgi:hypothetical protein